jgi:WhiB family transcriptional regulator, redox-sensing transcriptional regulator
VPAGIGRRDPGSQIVPGWASQPDAIESEALMTAADHRPEWWSLAACRHVDPDLFFPISATGPARAQVAGAKAVCARCPVRRDCLRYALAAGPVQGIWGGLSEDERRLLRQREAKARVRAARQPGPSRPAPRLAAHR